MKKLTMLAAAVLVALGTSAANAQDTTRKESKGEVKTPPTAASIVTVIDGSVAVAGKIATMKFEAPPTVEFVDVKSIVTAEADQATLKTALEKNKEATKQLQDAIKQHAALVTAINSHEQKPEPGDVVGAEIGEGDKLVIYFWKK